jgi:formylglycine-generating enzyme required for sulfatase activity
MPFEWACAYGEDEFGLWQAFEVGEVRQVLRWIPPGEFLMGSPESEPDRSDHETQHKVVLTEGYWLADSACTQALWQAVLGENPSRFSDDPNKPVEQVSWDDIVQRFLPALNDKLPGIEAALPSEEQWEYACRAGTTTAFWFGDQVSPELVNYDGNYPYAGGAKGKYRETTVPVKALPANGWGLYEMHGNVCEWCADRYGEYLSADGAEPASQPQDGAGKRVLRGGSWFHLGRLCRSAYRYAFHPDARNDFFGFRLARGAC